jgi:hypothetical protein
LTLLNPLQQVGRLSLLAVVKQGSLLLLSMTQSLLLLRLALLCLCLPLLLLSQLHAAEH